MAALRDTEMTVLYRGAWNDFKPTVHFGKDIPLADVDIDDVGAVFCNAVKTFVFVDSKPRSENYFSERDYVFDENPDDPSLITVE